MSEVSELLPVLIPLLLLLLAIGALAGILAGLLGVGGGIVLVPAFYYAFSALGYGSSALMQICLATSLATIIVTSIRSVLMHHKKGAVAWEILRGWAPGVMFGALIGMGLVTRLRSDILQGIFGLLGLSVAAYMAFGRPHWRLGQAMPSGPLRMVLAPVLGGLSVLMGIGGGSFGVPLMSLYGQPIHRAIATAAGFGALIAIPSVMGFLWLPVGPGAPPFTVGAVNVPAFALVVTMTMITTPYGVKLAHITDAKPLKRVFAVFLALVAFTMLGKVLGG